MWLNGASSSSSFCHENQWKSQTHSGHGNVGGGYKRYWCLVDVFLLRLVLSHSLNTTVNCAAPGSQHWPWYKKKGNVIRRHSSRVCQRLRKNSIVYISLDWLGILLLLTVRRTGPILGYWPNIGPISRYWPNIGPICRYWDIGKIFVLKACKLKSFHKSTVDFCRSTYWQSFPIFLIWLLDTTGEECHHPPGIAYSRWDVPFTCLEWESKQQSRSKEALEEKSLGELTLERFQCLRCAGFSAHFL